jgi:oligogalacturonide lyase
MIGQSWDSEIREIHDERSGRKLFQLTSTGNNVHFYFTENSFDSKKPEIYFLSDRATREKGNPLQPYFNIFKMDLSTGRIIQLTDDLEGGPVVGNITKTPDSRFIVYISGNKVKKLDTQSGQVSLLYEETGRFTMTSPSISPNLRYVAFARDEIVEVEDGPNYTGFKEAFYATKDGRITVAYLDGSGWFDALKDTHWLGHFQFCPDDGTLGTFCHEGPWNLVTQRIWLLDFVSREVKPCFRQEEQDSVGHEFWTQDGYIFFDNRGPGHDGTITSDRTQAVAKEVAVNENTMVPFVGLADRKGEVVKKIEMPFYCNHYHANPDNTLLVGDDVDELVMIDISGEKATLTPLCQHGTSWHTQSSHCHPTWSWDGNRILYASDRGGKVNLYMMYLDASDG